MMRCQIQKLKSAKVLRRFEGNGSNISHIPAIMSSTVNIIIRELFFSTTKLDDLIIRLGCLHFLNTH